jgi:phosphoribosylaminoimidazolecarboxamide formyltransferase/IMP cyclohydrolase
MPRIRRALMSVSNKDGLVDLAQGLRERGIPILSTGGTAAHLKQHGVEAEQISDYTGFPEILDGRLKTLHPKIFGGILARETAEHAAQLEENAIGPIDLVVVNLYPFEETKAKASVSEAELIEMIDIGGPSLIRAAAKNHERAAVVVDPADYPALLEALTRGEGELPPELLRGLAGKAFAHTADYDANIAAHFRGDEELPERLTIPLRRVQSLRYGENPHQGAALYRDPTSTLQPAIVDCEQLQGKELSYNNILDADAALNLVLELPDASVCILKHTNPCGAATSPEGDVAQAFRDARATDPVSAFGGIVSCNRPVTGELAKEIKGMFLEAVVAPAYEPEALKLLAKKKKLRLLRYDVERQRRSGQLMRSVSGGVLMQDFDAALEELSQAEIVTARPPSEEELQSLDFAWRICKHVKSNAIVFAGHRQLVGVGAGQMSRVDSVKLAATKAQLPLAGTVLASDAFFPFRDGVDAAHEAGATAVVQPGGSIRDEEVIKAADEHGMAMVLTRVRHFRH